MSLTMACNGNRLCIGRLPGRKRPCLYFWDPFGIRVVASFASEDAAADVESFWESGANEGARLVWDVPSPDSEAP